MAYFDIDFCALHNVNPKLTGILKYRAFSLTSQRNPYFLILLQPVSRALDLYKLAIFLCIVPDKEIRDPRSTLGIIFA
jgi:hypothetical protein